jgi:selenocysteine-specific elongation factor
MISGAFGFDSVLIVVSAVEGIKPQTVEHLEILKLLGVKDAILVISKKDLVPKDELSTKILEIQTFITKYKFNIQGVVPVSIYDEASIETLKRRLFSLRLKDKEKQNFFRMYIDRTFSIKGKGSVVTGTVLGQDITLKDKLFVCDINKACKIKNIQVHDQDVEVAHISNRVAINLANVDSKDLKKGFLISKKGYLRGFKTIDIAFSALGEDNMLHHNKTYIVYIGSKRVEAKINLIGTDYPLQEGFATIKSSTDIFSIYGEKLIIRDSNKTVAGGVVLNPISDPLKKRQKLQLLNALEERDFPKAYIVLLEAHKKGLGLVSSAQRFALSHEEALNEAKALEGCFIDEKELIVYPLASQIIIIDAIRAIYEKNPYALLSVSSIKLRLTWASDAFIQAAIDFLVEDKLLVKDKNLYKNANVKEDISDVLENNILEMLEKEDVAPPAPYNIYDSLDLDRKSGDDILKTLCKRKEVVRLEHNLFIHAKSLTKLMTHMKEIIKLEGHIDLRTLKEHYPLSRKYLIAYLDYLDKFSDIKNEEGKRFFTHS